MFSRALPGTSNNPSLHFISKSCRTRIAPVRTPGPKPCISSVHVDVPSLSCPVKWSKKSDIRCKALRSAWRGKRNSSLDEEEVEVSPVEELWKLYEGEIKRILQISQLAGSVLFVILYVWSTYSTPAPASWRASLDLALCFVFAADYCFRFIEAANKVQMVASVWNVMDLLAWLPPILEACLLRGTNLPFSLGRFDFRWFKILRAVRVMRLSLLASEMRLMHLSSSGALLSGAASLRLLQLVASVLTLLFVTSSIVHLVERIPWHDSLFFVTTTLTTVGYGDLVPVTLLGKLAVLLMICVGVVIIPVQSTNLYNQLAARRVTLGALPEESQATVIVSTRLTEVRSFSDFFSEFFQSLKDERGLPSTLRMVVLCNKPDFQFKAFQDIHEKQVTLVEGSALSERDLIRTRAESASAVLLLADRFSSSAKQEDLNIQFQVWALKSYTKLTPLYVQVIQKSSVQLIAPFLDPAQDVIVSLEQTRHRMLALSCICPGASTLIANLLRSATMLPVEQGKTMAAGRMWLRSYLNGCAFRLFEAPISRSVAGERFSNVVQWLFYSSGCTLIGYLGESGNVMLNLGNRRMEGGEICILLATSQSQAESALRQTYHSGPLSTKDLLETSRFRPGITTDDDDYFSEMAPIPGCIPNLEGYKNVETESIDFDDLPCDLAIEDHPTEPQPPRSSADALVIRSSPAAPREKKDVVADELKNHVILCGAEDSFLGFCQELRLVDPTGPPVAILHPSLPVAWEALRKTGPILYVRGDPSDAQSLKSAGASQAKSLVYLSSQRPVKESMDAATLSAENTTNTSRSAVLADAEALLTCYGVGEESDSRLVHAVVELCFTSSVRFLQPGLLLKGTFVGEETSQGPVGPRKSFLNRKRQERAAIREGLAEWQANPYFCSGRVTVPALADTFACQSFFNRGMLTDLMTELCGDDGRPGGAVLRQIPLPPGFVGRPYGALFSHLVLERQLIPLGLYRRKSENSAWRLPFVVTNPNRRVLLEAFDRVFVLCEREALAPESEGLKGFREAPP